MSKMIFINLPVTDLDRSIAFYEAIGGRKEPKFSNDQAAMIVLSRHHPRHAADPRLLYDVHRQADCRCASTRARCCSRSRRTARREVDATIDKAQCGRRQGRPGTEAGHGRADVRPQLRGSRRPSLGSHVDGRQGRRAGRLGVRGGLSHAGQSTTRRSRSRAFRWVPDSPQGWSATCASAGRWRKPGSTIGCACSASSARPEYLLEQPFDQVPAFSDGDVHIFETGAIVQYIGEQSERAAAARSAGPLSARSNGPMPRSTASSRRS